MESLFDLTGNAEKKAPLAERMRPRNIAEFYGQTHIASKGSLLMRAISTDRLGSCIFWGPPGSGKSSLANIIANSTAGNIVRLNAVSSGVSDVKKAAEEAAVQLKMYGKRTYLLLDECHRFSKTQSDSLLPFVEKGTLILIGSTTENPFASMTSALVSRCRVFEFKRLDAETIEKCLNNALADKERGLGNYSVNIEEQALKHISRVSGGDLRMAYNALEMAVLTSSVDDKGVITVTLTDAEQSIQRKALSFNEDLYYDILSAFCKCLRGSDANAAIYYSQRLIQGGCDPMIIARRLVVHSSEDVGMADPNALVVATSAMYALEKIGVPEALIPLTNAIIYVCEAEKSNSVVIALDGAKADATETRDDDIPPYLKDNSYGDKDTKAQSKKYKYPHDYGGFVKQQYLPDSLKDKVYYRPKDNGYELTVKEIRKRKGKED